MIAAAAATSFGNAVEEREGDVAGAWAEVPAYIRSDNIIVMKWDDKRIDSRVICAPRPGERLERHDKLRMRPTRSWP